MKKQSTGRRDARGGRKDEREKDSRGPRKDDRAPRSFEKRPRGDERAPGSYERGAGKDDRGKRKAVGEGWEPRPFKKYDSASKSESGWTKPDGKPMRKRSSKDDAGSDRGEKRPYERRNTTGSEGRSFKKSEGGFRGDDKKFGERKTRDGAPKYGDKRAPRGEEFGERKTRDDAPKYGEKRAPRGDNFEYKEKRAPRTERSDADRFTAKPEGDTNDFISSGRGKGGVDRGEKSGFERKTRSYDKDRAPREEASEKRTFGERRADDAPRTYTRRSDSDSGERGKSYGVKKGKPERPNKSFLKSGSEDNKPFDRFKKNKAGVPRRPGRDDSAQGRSRGDESAPRRSGRVDSAPRRSGSRTSAPKAESDINDGTIRLNRYIANAGICSRREADDYITAGLVSVNGEIVTELGTKVSISDDVRYNGERLKAEKNVYLVLNKPKDYITTSDDPGGRKTVMELVSKACKERIYPVGRLDRNTTGVLLFTNDGDLAKKLTHPATMVRKVYHVELDKSLKKADFEKLLHGVELEDGVSAVDDISYDAGGDKSQVGVELHSGKNRIVRRMFEHLGYDVVKLDRVIFAGLTKKDVPRGRWRMLTEVEIASLKMQTGKSKNTKNPKAGKDQLKLF
jgi:23S rRNA pseudouridine2605 synthase